MCKITAFLRGRPAFSSTNALLNLSPAISSSYVCAVRHGGTYYRVKSYDPMPDTETLKQQLVVSFFLLDIWRGNVCFLSTKAAIPV